MTDELFPPIPGGVPGDPQGIVHLDPLLERRIERHPWQVRSAQWRAWALAEAVFGPEVRTQVSGMGGYGTFRGLLTLTVPFENLEDHRRRESLFLAWASRDPVLTRVPFVFLFQPRPVPVP